MAEKEVIDFDALVRAISDIHDQLAARAKKAVNVSLTIRNWLIGCYIREYEMEGSDRAKYGERLMDELADALRHQGLKRCDRRELYRYRQFYLRYPQIRESLTPQLMRSLPLLSKYQLELPGKEEIREFIEYQMKDLGRMKQGGNGGTVDEE